mmetsp:Transcript_32591/g.81038  ORF Transcript_32591/g.81038 Transcript_32591/m.81038 type:complete len:260 (-) Transcript_32591:41-820(-)
MPQTASPKISRHGGAVQTRGRVPALQEGCVAATLQPTTARSAKDPHPPPAPSAGREHRAQPAHKATRLGDHDSGLAALLGGAAVRELRDRLLLLGPGDLPVLLREDQLDVARRAHVRVDAAVRTVGAPALLAGRVHLNVGDLELVDVEALDLRVALGVAEQVEQEHNALLRPARLAGRREREVLRLRSAPDATVEVGEGDRLLVVEHVLEVLLRLLERHATDRLRGLVRVLEVHVQVRAARLARLSRVLRLPRVLAHPG